MTDKYYATPQLVKELYKELKEKGKPVISFPQAIQLLMETKRLTDSLPPHPHLDGRMPAADFIDAYDKLPFEVDQDFLVMMEEREQNGVVVFPENMDLVCMQQLLTDVYYDQTLSNVYAFTFVYQGHCSYYFDDRELRLSPGDLFIATPGFSHRIFATPDTFALVILFHSTAFNIHFNDFLTADSLLSDFFRTAITDQKNGNYCIISCGSEDEEPRFYLQSLVCEYLDQNAYTNTTTTCLLKLFLTRIYNNYHDTIKIYKRECGTDRVDAKSIIRYIQNHYQSVTLGEVANYFHYNKTYLSRFIHQHYHQSFIEIITEIKIDHAKEYLSKTNKRISDIAQLVGYESTDHFFRMFKKSTGVSPSDYRKHPFR